MGDIWKGKPVREPYTVYISGPMRSVPGYNYPLFHDVEEWLTGAKARRTLGVGRDVKPLNPARNFNGDTTLPIRKYLSLALRQVQDCQAILLLPDWQHSEGARLEAQTAMDCGLDFWLWEPETKSAVPASRSMIEKTLDATELPPAMETRRGKVFIEPEVWTPEKVAEAVRTGRKSINWAREWHGLKPWPVLDDQPLHWLAEHGPEVIIETPNTETIEQEASRLVRNGERQKDYGHPRGDFDQIGKRWSLDLEGKLKEGANVTA